ncbi:MAG: serine/threonine-protein phosphatase [Oscillospiraceae bacterium]|nr:serine/threonine-protein phosphatase [Oscillospiraceae bacterium]
MRAVSVSNAGGRKNNEDRIGYAGADGIWCFVLCDGLGGQLCGDAAAEIVRDAVCGAFEKNPELSGKALYRYMEMAASMLGEERENDESRYNMSSTAVTLLTDGERAVWAHAGDSRLYYISDGKISSITDDHSLAFAEFKRGMITYDEIRRSPNQNKLLRCINDVYDFNPDVSDVIKLKKGDAFLMCTDGFWEYVTENDIESTLSAAASPAQWLEKMLEVLHKNEIEENDNYSAIAVMI